MLLTLKKWNVLLTERRLGGGSKLQVNLARYAKENQGINDGNNGGAVGNGKKIHNPPQNNKGKSHQNHSQVHNTGINSFSNLGKGKLFSDLFKNEAGMPDSNSCLVTEVGPVIEIADEKVAFKDLIGRALVGRCKDLSILRNLNSILADTGIAGVSLSYLGGLSLLLKFEDDDSYVKFMLDHQTWKDWFFSLDPWNCQSLPFERLAWVKIQGVPMHLADNDVLNNIAKHFGKIVRGSQLEAGDCNLSVSWIGLLVGDGNRIHGHVTLRWKNKQFHV
ncbi:hypothetical protein HanOQP8_Chr08g0301321 [Helianthus annuus]|nr:hypothetical protein HanIR_Chr08g0386041 [Helianthus annuus]KAJ0723691.1 hypothetical protein HanOQP8_Chr08g0301321 [Helianthus annuus]KAJ0903112.1 hypothetical protein HanPSC8_Chr08g0345241 [Helianthus annuus]